MPPWLRERTSPPESLREDRKDLVRRYMSAREADDRPDEVEVTQPEGEARPDVESLRVNAHPERGTPRETSVTALEPAGSRRRDRRFRAVAASEPMPHQDESSPDRPLAAAGDEAREQFRRESARREEAARKQVAAAVEQARLAAAEEVARQVAAAVDAVRRQAEEERVRGVQRTCQIERWRGYRTSRFYVLTDEGTLFESEPFRWRRAAPPPREGAALEAHETLVARLEANGWTRSGESEVWFATSFTRR